jgi:hypothetical protein
MGKDTNFTGQPVFNQVLKLITRQTIEQLSKSIPGSEEYVKKLDGHTHLVIMLFAVFNHFDSLREIEVGMQAEAHKLSHLGLDYLVKRSTLSEANKRRPSAFFAQVYALLLKKYAAFLAGRTTKEQKEWERLLYMMDSTTISLFDNILKGVGRHPKTGKKKGGMKVHTLMKYLEGVPMVVDLTSAAKHDHYLLKEVHLPKDSLLAIDRAYIDYAQFQRFTEEGVCYVTKMKKNLSYTVISSVIYVNSNGKVTAKEEIIVFKKGDLEHPSRKVEIWEEKSKQPVVLLTNNFEFSVEDLREIYKRRWAIETLYKQLKQNFQLHFFYGDSVNAIQIQTWVTLIANLLLTVIQQKIKRKVSFSQLVTMVRQTLMYYIDFIAFMENPNRAWKIISEEYAKSPPKIVQFELKFE